MTAKEEAIVDIISHKADFQKALQTMKDNSFLECDQSYWQHQLDVLDRIVKALTT
jgi:hypothetical protein